MPLQKTKNNLNITDNKARCIHGHSAQKRRRGALETNAGGTKGDAIGMKLRYYLARSCPDVEIVEDVLWEEPHFVKQMPDF